MIENYYKEALKKGLKEKKSRINDGEDPYLPSLDNILASKKVITEVNLGVMQVPTEWIVGTRTASRANAFAANFM
ncbi:MAG: BMP family ABC transporter substrate-binding protein, partial [Lachnospiraceae bacterium]|nr:BMP family ABC transporter substrate-binding protein [Lachnospiraceae bacterium]